MFLRSNKIIKIVLFSCLLLLSCTKKETTFYVNANVANSLQSYKLSYPNYLPEIKLPSNNPLTIEGIELGRKLYYDPILSNNGKSCSSCHTQNTSFTTYDSNSLPHINLGWNKTFLWNGKIEGTLETIMLFEVESFFQTDIQKLNQSAYYKSAFKKVYQTDTITSMNVAYALSHFFRVLVSYNSVCDKFLQRKGNLTTSQMNGFNIFTTEKGDCFHCHSLGLFTDNSFHNIGLDTIFNSTNSGRYLITNKISDIGLYKTPTLRNIELTAPYMHDGRFKTLEEVIEHYNSGVHRSNTIDPIMTKPGKEYGLGLKPNEIQDLVAFLKTLTDTSFTKNPMLQNPN